MPATAVSKALTAASDNAIALSQTLVAAGNLTLNGATGTANLDTQRQIIITSSGDDHLVTATVTGFDGAGAAIKDSFLLSNATIAKSNLNFLSVSQVTLSAAAAANIKVGTNTVGSTQWFVPNAYLTPYELSFSVQLVSGTGNCQIDVTYDEVIATSGAPQPAPAYAPATINPAVVVSTLQNLSASAQGAIDGAAIRAWRLTINSGTGTWKATAIQSGLSAA